MKFACEICGETIAKAQMIVSVLIEYYLPTKGFGLAWVCFHNLNIIYYGN